jgi:hypothetical protein
MVSFYPIRARRSSNHPWWDCETGQSASPGLWRGKIEKKVYALAGEEGGSEIDAECGFLHPTDVLGQIKGMGGTGGWHRREAVRLGYSDYVWNY